MSRRHQRRNVVVVDRIMSTISSCILFALIASGAATYDEDDYYGVNDDEMTTYFEPTEYDGETDDCPPTWQLFENYCYRYVQNVEQWKDAENACGVTGKGAHLVSVHTKPELQFLFSMIVKSGSHWLHNGHGHYHSYNMPNEHIWFGLSYTCRSQQNGPRWTDGSKVEYPIEFDSDLAKSDNETNSRSSKCVAFFLTVDGGKWVKKKCDSYASYVCKMPRFSNMTVPADSALQDDDICGAWDWCYNRGWCYKLLGQDLTWSDALASCRLSGGDLISIHSRKEFSYIHNDLTFEWSDTNSYWTGLNKLESVNDRFEWSDGSPVSFLPMMGFDTADWHSSSCAVIALTYGRRLASSDWKHSSTAAQSKRFAPLRLSRCDHRFPAICKKPPTNVSETSTPSIVKPELPTSGGCPKGWIRFESRCYRTFGVDHSSISDKASFKRAQKVCAKYRANLVSIKSEAENLFVLSLLTDPVNQSWIGLIQHVGRFRWLDQTPITFTSFETSSLYSLFANTNAPASGVNPSPNSRPNLFHQRTGSDGCFVMNVVKSPGSWEVIRATTTQLDDAIYQSGSYPVRRAKRTSPLQSYDINETSGDAEWFCNDDEMLGLTNFSFYKHGSQCYQVVADNPLSWDEARKFCEAAGSSSSLTSILNQQEFGFLVSLSKLHPELSNFWIGMSVVFDTSTNSVHTKWVDDWPVWLSKWDSTLIADSNRGCVQMRKSETSMSWFQESCNKRLPFICKHRRSKVKAPQVAVDGVCDDGWLQGSTQCYHIDSNDFVTGSDAIFRCWREYNASLASFPSEDDWLMISRSQKLKDSKHRLFIGLIQKVHGNFEWLDGSALEFVNWAPQEPRFGWNPYVEVCVEMAPNGLWYDAGCHETRPFICSKPKTARGSTEAPVQRSETVSLSTTSDITIGPTIDDIADKPTTSDISNFSENLTGNDSSSASSALLFSTSAPSTFVSAATDKSSGSHRGVIAGIVICILFVLFLAAFVVVVLYRRYREGKAFFGSRPADSMRFEVLTEHMDE